MKLLKKNWKKEVGATWLGQCPITDQRKYVLNKPVTGHNAPSIKAILTSVRGKFRRAVSTASRRLWRRWWWCPPGLLNAGTFLRELFCPLRNNFITTGPSRGLGLVMQARTWCWTVLRCGWWVLGQRADASQQRVGSLHMLISFTDITVHIGSFGRNWITRQPIATAHFSHFRPVDYRDTQQLLAAASEITATDHIPATDYSSVKNHSNCLGIFRIIWSSTRCYKTQLPPARKAIK